jgi:hypothetical protein
MTLNDLPDAITFYFQHAPAADPTVPQRCFTTDARVHDDGHVHQGHAAIGAWIDKSARSYRYHSEPLSVVPIADGVQVIARISGEFPGSPLQFHYRFGLREGLIDTLAIGL